MFWFCSSTEINECLVIRPCQNGAECVNTPGSYKCICPPGWTGTNCEIGEHTIPSFRKDIIGIHISVIVLLFNTFFPLFYHNFGTKIRKNLSIHSYVSVSLVGNFEERFDLIFWPFLVKLYEYTYTFGFSQTSMNVMIDLVRMELSVSTIKALLPASVLPTSLVLSVKPVRLNRDKLLFKIHKIIFVNHVSILICMFFSNNNWIQIPLHCTELDLHPRSAGQQNLRIPISRRFVLCWCMYKTSFLSCVHFEQNQTDHGAQMYIFSMSCRLTKLSENIQTPLLTIRSVVW